MSKYSLLRYRKNPKVEPNWRTRGDTLRFFIHSVANQKNEGGALLVKKKFSEKKSHNAENTARGDPLDFQHPFCRKTPKKLKGGPFGEFFFRKKVSQRRKYSKAVPFGPFEFLR